MERVVIVGVSGDIGRSAVEACLDHGLEVKGLAHDRQDLPQEENLEMQGLDLTDPEALGEAVSGEGTVVLCPVHQGPKPLDLHRKVTGAVLDQDLDGLVVTTALHADQEASGVRLLAHAAEMEEVVGEADVPTTVLRPGLLLDDLFRHDLHEPLTSLSLPFPPNHSVGMVSARDVGRAIAHVVEEGPPRDRSFDLHIPGGVSGQWMAERMTDFYGRTIEYEEVTEDLTSWLDPLPIGPAYKELYAELLSHVREQEYLGDAEAILAEVDGFEYGTFERFLHEDIDPRERIFATPQPPTVTPPELDRRLRESDVGEPAQA